MDRVPLGIRQLDTVIDGGAPSGSVVLLSGEAGAGSREFMYTSAAINGLATADPDLHDLYYGDLAPEAALPDEVHYISFTGSEAQFRREVAETMETEIAEGGLEAVTFHDLSAEFFNMSPIPREWYADDTPHIRDMRARHDREGVLGNLGDLLSKHAAGNIVVLDSLTDLVGALNEDLEWSDVNFLMNGLAKAVFAWDGLVLTEVNHEALTTQQYGQLTDAATGTMEFAWETGGSERARTLVFKQFRGVLSRIEAENIVKFETEIGDAGFDISDVRKIR